MPIFLLFLSLSIFAGRFEESSWKSNCTAGKDSFQLVFKSKSGDAAEDDMSVQIDFKGTIVPVDIPPALYFHFDRTKNNVCDNLPVLRDGNLLTIFFLQDQRPSFSRLNAIVFDTETKKIISLEKDIGQVFDEKWGHKNNKIRLHLIHGWKIDRKGSDGPDIVFSDWKNFTLRNGRLHSSWEKKIPKGFLSQDLITPALQLISVRTTGWNTREATVRLYERKSPEAEWQMKTSFPGVIGRNGLAWGGSGQFLSQSGEQKQEGDGKAPAGVFALGRGIAYEVQTGTKLPFVRATDDLECVDDVKSSAFYNQVVDRSKVKADWTSAEEMKRPDDLYKYVIEVGHNPFRQAGSGSCIFLHVWKNAESGTAGCTAMDEMRMKELFTWVDPKKQPALVQMPDSEYERLKFSWELPE